MRIELVVDELALIGFDARDGASIGDAVQAELARLLGTPDSPFVARLTHRASGTHVARLIRQPLSRCVSACSPLARGRDPQSSTRGRWEGRLGNAKTERASYLVEKCAGGCFDLCFHAYVQFHSRFIMAWKIARKFRVGVRSGRRKGIIECLRLSWSQIAERDERHISGQVVFRALSAAVLSSTDRLVVAR